MTTNRNKHKPNKKTGETCKTRRIRRSTTDFGGNGRAFFLFSIICTPFCFFFFYLAAVVLPAAAENCIYLEV